MNWFLWPREPRLPPDSTNSIYLWCPRCGYEVSAPPEAAKTITLCPRCGDKGSVLRPSGDSHHGKAESPTAFVTLALLDLNVLFAAALIFFSARQKASQKQQEPLYFIHVCRTCRRRLRYLDRQVGHLGRCPACKSPFMFPEPTSPPLPREALD